MMRATSLLEDYSKKGWINHPDINNAMMITALKAPKPKDYDLVIKKQGDRLAEAEKNATRALNEGLLGKLSPTIPHS